MYWWGGRPPRRPSPFLQSRPAAYHVAISAGATMAKKILIADDDPVIIKLLQVNLEMEGYEVIIAEDGEQAVERAKTTNPDLVILDIMMPNMDGWTARKALMQVQKLKDTPVIFLSARAQQADIQKGYDADVAEYVTKPFDPMELLEIVEGVLNKTYKRPEKPLND